MTNILNMDKPLTKDDIQLQLLNTSHYDELEKLASDERIWEFGHYPFHENHLFKEKWLKKALSEMEQNTRVCFVIFHKGKMCGSTSYYHIDTANRRVSIGYTWLHPDNWGSTINRLIKLMMFEHAFEKQNIIRVEFTVDSLNLPSQNALQKLGIKQEGLLRNHMILPNGRIRHTYIYSVIPEEWARVKQNIERMIK